MYILNNIHTLYNVYYICIHICIYIHVYRYLTGGESTRRRASVSRRGGGGKTQGGGGSTKRRNSLNTTSNNNSNTTNNNSNSNKNKNATNINNECITDDESLELSRLSQIYLFITIKSYELINHPIFIYLQVVVIFMTLINVGLETDINFMSNQQNAYIVNNIEIIFLSFFTIEIGVRILSFGLKPFAYFRDRWNIFDVLIIAG